MLRLRRIAPPDPTRLEVAHAGRTFTVELKRRESARRMTLRVSSASGEIALTVPSRTRIEDARAFLDGHAGWIAARMAKLPDRVAFVAGAVVPFRGVPHRIVHWSRLRAPTRTARDEADEPVIAVCGPEAGVPGRVRRFLVGEAEADLRRAVAVHTGRLGIVARRVTLRDTTSRWGSCSSGGALSFSWRLILAPASVLDYLAAHEVAHLKELNHSHRFWKVVHDLCPHTEAAERWLKRHGTGLHRYG